MPFDMDMYVQSVVVQGKIYVGAGIHEYNHPNNYTVMECDISSRRWSRLPQHETCGFAMVVIKNQLVLVGGSGPRFRVPSLGVWEADIREWTHPYPNMHEPRTRCSAVAYNEWLVVAGGIPNGQSLLSSVEVLNTDNNTWCYVPPMPTAFADMKTAIVGEMCYFMGGCIGGGTHSSGYAATDRVFSVSLPVLVSQVSSQDSLGERRHRRIWNEITGFVRSTPLSLGGSLLALGGRVQRNQATSSIRRYRLDRGEWERVGDLPSPRFNCASCALTEGDRELVIVGGCSGGDTKMKRMDIAMIN